MFLVCNSSHVGKLTVSVAMVVIMRRIVAEKARAPLRSFWETWYSGSPAPIVFDIVALAVERWDLD